MTPTQWDRVKSVFASALALQPNQRASFLETECGTDNALRQEIESLLSSHDEADDFIERPPAALKSVFSQETDSVTISLGTRVGAYRLEREIGHGGMGTVYLATRADDEFQKRVAIKLIRHGMESEFVLRRFRNERQILARLEHANIARLIDGGSTDDGRPYFIMEYVEGVPITHYCDQNRLQIGERLEIFLRVCSAVQYAHERGIVHRDLKPTNVLVKERGNPKLLDFGIARLLDPATDERTLETTLVGLRLMTPAYASPEQLRGEPATFASDVYSLGIMLYELLCGRRPGELGDRRTEASTEKPSDAVQHRTSVNRGGEDILITPEYAAAQRSTSPEELQSELAHNLDAIVLRAIRLDPHERYESVAALAADLQRHLAGVSPARGTSAASGRTSLAVLPFRNLSAEDATDAYLGVSMADALITKLSNLPKISIRSTSSVLKYVHEPDAAVAGRELAVQYVLDGRIRKSGDRVRITVQLMRVSDNAPVWAAQFEEHLEDILKLEDSLSGQVALALVPQISGEEARDLFRRETVSARAYQAYLKGRWHWNLGTEESLAKALLYFMEAIAEDPHYASAHAGVAEYYTWMGLWGGLPPAECFAAAKQAAAKAVEINPALAEAHAASGLALWALDHNFDGAQREFELAINLSGNCAPAHHWLGLMHSSRGKHDQAIAEAQRARSLDPFSPVFAAGLAVCHYYARNFTRALEVLREPEAIRAETGLIYELRSWCHLQLGEVDQSLTCARKAVELCERNSITLCALAYSLVASGDRAGAKAVQEELVVRARQRYVSGVFCAWMHLALGDRRDCLRSLEHALEQGDWWVLWIGVDPRLDTFRGEPRFTALVDKLHLQSSREHVRSAPRPALARWKYAWWAAALIVLCAAGWLAYTVFPRPAPLVDLRMTKLTMNGNGMQAALSEDGRFVVYSELQQGRQSLWLRQVIGAQAVRIMAPLEADIRQLTVAPDGSTVHFVATRKNEPGRGILYQVPVLGGSVKRLADNVPGSASLSPDGRQLALLRENPAQRRDELAVTGLDGTGEKLLLARVHPERFTVNSSPAWSHDGKLLACPIEASDAQGFFINILAIRLSNGSRRIVRSPRWQNVEQITWLADGSGLLVIGQEQDSSFRQIWYLPYSSGEPKRLTNDLTDYSGLSVSADARSLVSAQIQSLTNVYVQKADSAADVTQITQGTGRYFDLSWTPQNTLIYASDASGNADIWTMNGDGGSQRQITSGVGRSYAPVSSPDGKFVLFHSNRSGSWNVWRMDTDGSPAQQLTFGEKDNNWPQISADGQWAYYHRTGADAMWNIWKVPVTAGKPVQLTTKLTTHPAIAKDGRIACWYSEDAAKPRWKLAVLGPAGGEPLKLFDQPATVTPDTTIRWTADGQGIAYVDNRNGASNVWMQPLDGSPARPLTRFTSGQIYSFDWSRDGRLAYSRGVSTSDVVLLRDVYRKQ